MILGTYSRLRSVALAGVLAVLAVLALVAGGASEARANGVPVTVDLSYIDLSNWGPQDASGSAELIFAEGIIRIHADGLPQLEDELYQAWLVNSEAGDAISAGRFNASASGAVTFEGTLPPIADFGFDLLILTVEPDPDSVPQPTEDRSIGGYFSLIGIATADGQGGEAQGGSLGGSQGLQAPGSLPNTGDPAFITDVIRVTALAMALGLSVVVGVRLSRRTA